MNLNCLHRKKEQRKEISKQKKVFLFIFLKNMSSLVCRAISRTAKFLTQRKQVLNPLPPPKKKMPCVLTSKDIN